MRVLIFIFKITLKDVITSIFLTGINRKRDTRHIYLNPEAGTLEISNFLMLAQKTIAQETQCYHCGDDVPKSPYTLDDKPFCCLGCQGVYQLLSSHDLGNYYAYNDVPGQTQNNGAQHFEYLDEAGIAANQKVNDVHSNWFFFAYSLAAMLVNRMMVTVLIGINTAAISGESIP
jgi:endogenous inhibitor of DNA gyrase (YacG/DUF329 family)